MKNLTLYETAEKVKKGELSSVALVKESLRVIKEKNPEVNAFIEVFEEEALAQAAEVDSKAAKGEKLGRLAGIPVGIKDNILYKGHIASSASRMLTSHKAAYNSSVTQKLLDEDAVIIGRFNMDECAMGSSNQTSFYGPVKNPVDLTRVPGGSSGGSAAAVAAGMVRAALGSDTGGSIRQPASFCGVVGLKATYGRVSRNGVIAMASSADQVGPITVNVRDSAYLLSILAGQDIGDAMTETAPPPVYNPEIPSSLNGVRIGIPRDFLEGLNPEIKEVFLNAAETLKALGADMKDITLPYAKYGVPCYYILTCAEACSNLSRFDGIRYGYAAENPKDLNDVYAKTRSEGFGKEVKKRMMIGYRVLGKEKYENCYIKASLVRGKIREDFQNAFKDVDIIFTPTTPNTAPRIGEEDKSGTGYLADLYTCPGNMADLPGISVPVGNSKAGLPIGVQFLADKNQEELMLKAALAFENKNKGAQR